MTLTPDPDARTQAHLDQAQAATRSIFSAYGLGLLDWREVSSLEELVDVAAASLSANCLPVLVPIAMPTGGRRLALALAGFALEEVESNDES